MKTIPIKLIYATCFALLSLSVGNAIADIFGFELLEFWQGYLIASGSYFGVELHQALDRSGYEMD